MAIRVRAVKSISYGGRRYQAGTHFEASNAHAKVLSALGKISLDPLPESVVKTRQMKPEAKVEKAKEAAKPVVEEKKEEPKKEEPKKVAKKAEEPSGPVKSQMYVRRDLTAEEPK